MHAYLIVGSSGTKINEKAEELAKKLKADILRFPLSKIEDSRSLKEFTSLKITIPTAIFIENIEEATEEALNSFLKSLEEPQESLYYILTASSSSKVLPTIVSRCQIVKVKNENKGFENKDLGKFMNMEVGEKFTLIDKIKDRGEAKEFIISLIEKLHFDLLNSNRDKIETAKNLDISLKVLNNLKSNGNVGLQLTYLVINLIV